MDEIMDWKADRVDRDAIIIIAPTCMYTIENRIAVQHRTIDSVL